MKTNTRNKIFKKSCLLIVILALILIAIGNGNSAYAATSKSMFIVIVLPHVHHLKHVAAVQEQAHL